MNPITAELTNAAAPELAKATENFIQRLFGPVAEEAGLMLAEKVRLRRFEASLKIADRAREMLEAAHIEPKSVPLKTLVPLLEGASMEEDEVIQEKWSALLADSAALEGNVIPSFVEVLRQMSPAEAKLLDLLAQQSFYSPEGFEKISIAATDPILNGLNMEQIEVLVSSLARSDVLSYMSSSTAGPGYLLLEGAATSSGSITLAGAQFQLYPSPFGRAFMKACHAPKPATE